MEAISRRPSSLFITLPALVLSGMVLHHSACLQAKGPFYTRASGPLRGGRRETVDGPLGRRGTQCTTGADKTRVFPGNPIELTLTLRSTTFLFPSPGRHPLNGLRLASGNSETHLTGESGLLARHRTLPVGRDGLRAAGFSVRGPSVSPAAILDSSRKESEVDDPFWRSSSTPGSFLAGLFDRPQGFLRHSRGSQSRARSRVYPWDP